VRLGKKKEPIRKKIRLRGFAPCTGGRLEGCGGIGLHWLSWKPTMRRGRRYTKKPPEDAETKGEGGPGYDIAGKTQA